MDIRPAEMFIPTPTIGGGSGLSGPGSAPDPEVEKKAIVPLDTRLVGGGGLASDYGLPGSEQLLPGGVAVAGSSVDLLADVPGFTQSATGGGSGPVGGNGGNIQIPGASVSGGDGSGNIQVTQGTVTNGDRSGFIDVTGAQIATPASPSIRPDISGGSSYGGYPTGNAGTGGVAGVSGYGYGGSNVGGQAYGGSGSGGYGIAGGSAGILPSSGGSVVPESGGSSGGTSDVSGSDAPGKVGKKKKKKKNKTSKLQKSGGSKAPGGKKSGKLGTSKLPSNGKILANYMLGKVKPMTESQMSALEEQFGKFKGKGMNTKPTEKVGPMGGTLLHKAYDALAAGDEKAAKNYYKQAGQTQSPIMLDLDGDGKLGTTGVSTAKNRIDGQVGKTVSFDIDGDGKKDQIEWMKGSDGMLVDDRDGGATAAMNGNGEIDGKRLFGDEGGKFGNGYEKLKQLDRDGDGKLTGAELDGLKVWVDNGDARVGGGELRSLRDLGVTEISVRMQLEKNERGEDLMRSSFVQNGQSRVSEDVWFAQQ